MTTEEINQSFQDFQDDLAAREQHLKLLVSFKDESLDDLLDLLNDLRGTAPTFTDKRQPSPESTTEEKP